MYRSRTAVTGMELYRLTILTLCTLGVVMAYITGRAVWRGSQEGPVVALGFLAADSCLALGICGVVASVLGLRAAACHWRHRRKMCQQERQARRTQKRALRLKERVAELERQLDDQRRENVRFEEDIKATRQRLDAQELQIYQFLNEQSALPYREVDNGSGEIQLDYAALEDRCRTLTRRWREWSPAKN